MNIATPIIAEFGTILLTVAIAYAGVKTYGKEKTIFFLLGAVLWSGLLENLSVLQGSYNYYAYKGMLGSWFQGYFFWLGLAPLWIELAWGVVALSLFIIIREVLLPGKSPVVQAALAGLLAVNMDFIIDPIAVASRLWDWLVPSIYVLGVPLHNWVGWFMVVFFYYLIFDYTILDSRPIFILGRIERYFLPTRSSLGVKTARFAFRIIVINFFVIIVLTIMEDGLAMLSHVVG
jgi:uncharacterized membrane protein